MRWLQTFSFKKSSYERPNQNWICGRASHGEPCLAGPDQKGKCQTTFECRPLKKGGRWHCTRPTSQGGPCPEGPMPDGKCCRPLPKCSPVRSLRAWRGLAVLLMIAATSSALLVMLTTKAGKAIVSPGELSFQHSSYKSQCSDCHRNVNSEAQPIAWLHSADVPVNHSNNELCLKCHNLGPQPLAAHALSSGRLKEMTQHALEKKTSKGAPLSLRLSALICGNPKDREDGLACASCHKEHHGKKHDLARLSNFQCQNCHAVQFASFSSTHPPFKNYPFRRRTRIDFDHRSHLQLHFKEEKFSKVAPTSCSDCHSPDPTGSAMAVKSFDQTCAICHSDQIKGIGRVGAPGIAVLRLPGLDLQTLRAGKIAIGDWPEGAEGSITPFMELILASQPETDVLLKKLSGVDLLDLSKANAATVSDAASLAWSVKDFFYEFSAKGHAGLEERLKATGKLSTNQMEAAAGLLSAEVIQAARTKWFPNLAAEIAQHRAAKQLEPPKANATSSLEPSAEIHIKPEEWVARGGWYVSDTDYSISYRPRGHADSFLQSWLNLTVAAHDAKRLFDSLSDSKAPGLCMKCHSVDAFPRPWINWRAYQPDPFEHRFTRFSHVTHFSLLDDRGCQTCHSLDVNAPRESSSATFEKGQRNPTVFHSNFKSIELAVCTSCHTEKFAGESCLTCHNYHVGHFIPTLPRQQWGRPGTNLTLNP